MSVLDLIKTRSNERKAEADIAFWKQLPELQANGRNADALEAAIIASGRTMADAEHAQKLLERHAEFGNRAERKRAVAAKCEPLRASAKAKSARADALALEVPALRAEAARESGQVTNLENGFASECAEHDLVVQQLARLGHPASVAELAALTAGGGS